MYFLVRLLAVCLGIYLVWLALRRRPEIVFVATAVIILAFSRGYAIIKTAARKTWLFGGMLWRRARRLLEKRDAD